MVLKKLLVGKNIVNLLKYNLSCTLFKSHITPLTAISPCKLSLSRNKSSILQKNAPNALNDEAKRDRIRRIRDIGRESVSERVRIAGWLMFSRMGGQFIILRDSYGSVQVIVSDPLILVSIKDLPLESVLEVVGVVRMRPSNQTNECMDRGEIEIVASEVKLLNKCRAHLPFPINQPSNAAKEHLRLQYRYLDMRTPQLQRNLRLRSQVLFNMRQYLASKDFVDVETPVLFRKTPGGAREFIVPTHDKGKYFCLPQSPQQFKQLLMVGGIDRYMQVGKCFRDESAKPDRQPEFTQVDLEMSFVDENDVKEVVEGMLVHSWPSHLPPLHTPFPSIQFSDAIKLYGSDKPDTRFSKLLVNVTDCFDGTTFSALQHASLNKQSHSIQAVKFSHFAPHITNKDLKHLGDTLKASFPPKNLAFFAIVPIKEDGSWSGSFRKLIGDQSAIQLSERLAICPGDVFIVCAGPDRNACLTAGKFRTELSNLLKEKGISVHKREGSMHFLWVENFPLFLPKEDGSEGLESAHHPFTAPHPDDTHLIYHSPQKVRGLHYDLVLNGAEVAGGSIRIHQATLQKHVLDNILKEDSSSLGHLIEALDLGAPPHGGIALGVDRYMSILCNAASIRDVIAFPKSSEGKCLLSRAPAEIPPSDLHYYHLPTHH